jgi:hypothetical protein
MARPAPTAIRKKVHNVQLAVGLARGVARRHFDLSGQVAPGVELVVTQLDADPLVLSLWSFPQDIAELCGDGAYPATAALLAIDGEQARAAAAAGHSVDLSQFTRSESNPGLYYVLLDHVSRSQIHAVLHRLVPALPPDARAA